MLIETLGIKKEKVISLIGAGGKTSTMFRLARELNELFSNKVITTTTTKILKPNDREVDQLIIAKKLDYLLNDLSLSSNQLITVAKEIIKEDKLKGIDSKWVDKLAEAEINYDIIIVEADGASGKDFKIPDYYEPVIPESTDLLLPIVGSRIFNQKLTSENIHRAFLLKKINQQFRLGQLVTPRVVVDILLSQSGYDLLTKQQKCRVVPLLNQVDTKRRYDFALKVAKKLMERGINMVLLTAVKNNVPVVEVIKK